MNLAPILISVYNRKDHFVKCIDALSRNRLASESVLYIVSDAAFSSEDEQDINDIRDFIKTIIGFKTIIPIFREKNFGAHESILQAINFLLKKHTSVIFLEDDILTSINFLEYMNEGLKMYEDDERIITITGYAPPFKLPWFYKKDIWVNRRQCAWGFATWSNKWFKIDFNDKDRYSELLNSKKLNKFVEDGNDLLDILRSDSVGEFQAIDIRICYHQCLFDKLTLYPVISKTYNIGFDGTGLRCGISNYYHVELDKGIKKIIFVKNISECYYLKIIARKFYDNKSILDLVFPFLNLFRKRIIKLLIVISRSIRKK